MAIRGFDSNKTRMAVGMFVLQVGRATCEKIAEDTLDMIIFLKKVFTLELREKSIVMHYSVVEYNSSSLVTTRMVSVRLRLSRKI
jgi:hypothetical protein